MIPVTTYNLDSVQTIKDIQAKYKDDIELKSVAQELVQNSLNENQKGELIVSDNLVLVKVDQKDNVEDTVSKIQKGVDLAKLYREDRVARSNSLDQRREHSRSHGRGFFLLMTLGWEIVTLPGSDSLMIAAVRS